ncbi:MAG: OmpA family protein [Alphaproteobacteria bacterium]|nr:OmpA family protein [Alphaproteobacteria bacterium]
MRFRLPPPAPETGGPTVLASSPAPAGGLPPPPPATGAPKTGRLPPPARPEAGAPKPRRLAALDTSALPVAAAPVVTGHSVTFLYKAGGTALDAKDRARLGSLAAKLVRKTGFGVEIRAYAGSAESAGVETRRAALLRAMEIRRLLIAAGVPEARIVTRAAGRGGESGARVDVMLVGRT